MILTCILSAVVNLYIVQLYMILTCILSAVVHLDIVQLYMMIMTCILSAVVHLDNGHSTIIHNDNHVYSVDKYNYDDNQVYSQYI